MHFKHLSVDGIDKCIKYLEANETDVLHSITILPIIKYRSIDTYRAMSIGDI